MSIAVNKHTYYLDIQKVQQKYYRSSLPKDYKNHHHYKKEA